MLSPDESRKQGPHRVEHTHQTMLYHDQFLLGQQGHHGEDESVESIFWRAREDEIGELVGKECKS